MLKTEDELFLNANLAIDLINEKLKGKKITGLIQIHDFIITSKDDNKIISIKNDKKISYYEMNIPFSDMKLHRFYYRGLNMQCDLQWDCIFKTILDTKDEKIIASLNEIDTYQLIHSNGEIEIYCTHLYIIGVGHFLVLYDDISNYFEETTIEYKTEAQLEEQTEEQLEEQTKKQLEEQLEEQTKKQIITKEEGVNILLKLKIENLQNEKYSFVDEQDYHKQVKNIKNKDFTINFQHCNNIFKKQTLNQILQILLL